MSPDTLYRLSRVQAEGWKAARALPVSGLAEMAETEIAARNPYPREPERARWLAGFVSAI